MIMNIPRLLKKNPCFNYDLKYDLECLDIYKFYYNVINTQISLTLTNKYR